MVNPAMAFALVLAALPLGPSTAGLFTKRFRLRRETGANATVFSHVYNIRMPRCESCAADVAEPTTALQEARGETTQQQMYEHTLEGEKQMVFTHRINIPPQACGCPSTDTLQALLSRLEALESQVAAFRDQCPGGSCCAATQAGNGQTDIQGLCSRHGTFDFSKCHCVCEKGWSGPTCAESSCPDNCSGHGRCVDGECICRKGFTGESCELTACPDDCNDQGRCVEGKCVCFPGYRGPTCGEPSCPGNCQGHGKCVKDTCICDPGFTGPDCGARACPENCKDQGKCIDGTCHCDAGFAGPDCSMRSCPENCSNRGTCIEGKCICNPGYAGTDCGSRSCPENCKNRGQCINGKCVCNPGFTGPACGARSCPENCQNHGQCINGKCVCNPGYSGPSCGSRTCPDNCSGRGTCEDGRCACSEGYTGPNCGIRTCPENCLGRGQCENGRCVCGDGFTGPNCGTKTCPDNCKNRGRCEDGRCVCEEGFTGYNCGTKTCPDNCRNKGRCEDGKCVCEEGFTGPNCGTKTCPENCRNKGLCEDGKCVCEEGFTGPNCGTRTCPDNCKNQGLCEDGKCVCHEGFTGPNCGAKTCLDNCNSHGQCVDGQCVCQAGYGGINCRTRTCPNNCNNRGRCENGKCVCEEGYVGPICGLKVCLNNCNNRGRCQKGTCVCRRGYTGPDCGEETCPGQCQGRGLCVNGRCQCQAGFTGLDCSERMCPKACSQHGRCEDGKCVCHDGFTGDDCSTAVPAVEGLRVRAREETSVTVEWQRPQTPVDGFEISFRPTKEDDGVLSSRLRSTATAFNQSGLAPGEEYLVTIRTQKDQTLGPETTMTITTRIDGPKHVRVTEVTQTSLTLHWDRPAAHVDRYLVTYVSAAGIPRQVVVPASGEEVVTLTDLDSGAEYTLTVTAERGSEASVPASTVATTAPDPGPTSSASDEPPTPQTGAPTTQPPRGDSAAEPHSASTEAHLGDLSVTGIASDRITLSWRADPGVFDHFSISYNGSAAPVPTEVLVPGDQRTTELSALQPGAEYEIQLRGVSEGVHTLPVMTKAKTAARKPHETPTLLGGLAVTSIAEDGFGLGWKARKGVFDSFLVRYEDVGGRLGSQETSVPGDQRATAIRDLDAGTEYTISLYGVRKGQLSRALKTTVTTASAEGDGMLARVEDLTASDILEDSVMLSWTVQDGDFDFFLIQYRDVDDQTQELTIRGDQTSVIIPGLLPATMYTFTLFGVSDDKQSRPSTVNVTTALVTPTLGDLLAADVTHDSLRLSWVVQDGEFDSFLLQYNDSQGQSKTLPVDAGLHSTTVSGLQPAETYTFELYGVSNNTQSEPVSLVAKTASPEKSSLLISNLSSSDITSDSLRLSWTTEEGVFDSFLIQYQDAEGNPQELPIDGDLSSVTISGLRPSKIYKFLLYGVSGDRRGKPLSMDVTTAPAEKAVAPARLGELAASDITWDSLRLSWNVSSGDFDSFLILYRDAQGKPQELAVPGTLRAATISGLKPSKKYKFLLHGISGAKRSKAVSAEATTAAAKKALVPARLGQLSVSDITSDSLQLSWNVPSGDFDSFLILYRDAQGNPQELAVPGDLRIATISDLKLSKKYKFLLHGISGAKRSKAVSTEATTAAAKKALVPARLGQLSVSDITSDSLQLSWNVPSGDFDSFLILYRDAQGNPQELPVPGDLRIATISDLKPSKKYKFLLHGISGAKRSKAVSTEATTASAPKKAVGRLPKLGDLSVSEVQKDSLTLSWTVPEGEFDSFLILYKDSEGAPRELAVDGHLRATFITGLKPSQKYKFALYGVSEKRRAQPVSAEAITAAREDMPTPSPKLGELTVSDVTKDSLRLSWSDQGRAYDTFLILYRDAEGRPRGLPLSGDHRTTVVTGLVPSTKYTFLLYGVNGRNRSIPISADATTETAVSPLPMLTDLSISKVTEDSLRLSWTTRGGDFDSFLIQYRDAEGNPQERVVDGDQQETTISGLVPSEKYTFYLQGIVGEARVGPLSSDVITASPVKASSQLPELGDLSASDVTEKSVRLSWTSHSGHFDSFLIQYRDTDGRLQELPVDGDREDASISNLEPSKKYTIVLYGISEGMRTQPRSTEFTTTAETAVSPLPMLTDLSISKVTEDSLRLSWTTQGRDFDSFLIQYRDAEGNPQERVVDGGQQETTISGLVPSEKYTFYLQGIVGEARVGPLSSDVITASPAKASSQLPELGDLSASDVTGKSVRLSWTSHSGHFDSFLIQYKDTDGRLQELPVDGDREDATISNLEPSKKYTIVLYGISEGMRTQPRSTEFTTTAASPAKASSQLPELGDLSASDVTEKSVRLSWTSHSGHFDSFLIQYRDTDGRLQELPVDGDREDATISSLEPSKKYTVVLYGISEGMRTQPRSTEFTTTAASAKPVTRPARLGELSASDITRDSLRLSWSLQDGDFDSYLIQYRDAAGRVQELPVDRDHRSATISGLRPSKKYKFILYGLSGERRSKSIFTEATTATLEKATTQPPKLGDLSVSDITKDSLQLSWDVEEGVFGSFLIQYRDADGTPRELTVDGDFRTARIVGLKPAKKYKFSLYGISGDRRTKAVSAEATTAPPEKAISLSPKLGEFFVSDITKDSLQLTWTIEDGDFDSFVIQYRDADGQIQELVIEGDHHTTTVAGLLPSRKYKFNLYGISRNRRTKAVSTEATTAFPEAVGQQAAMLDDLYLSDVGPHSVQLSWDASEGAFDSFLVQYVDSQGLAPSREMLLVGDARTAPIGGLQPSTEYTFTLSGLQRGQKRADLNTVGRTSRLELEAPRDLEFRNIQETSLVVSWSPPYMAVDNFKVSYQLADGGEPQSISVDGKSTKVPLKGLTPGARYEVNVMSIRGFEESEPLTGYVTTVPDGPTDLRAVNVTETSALLLWRPALAVVDTYIVTYSAQNVPTVTKTLSGNTAALHLDGLKVDTEYTAKIQSAKGSNRSSPATTTFTTSADAPRDLTASRVTPRSAVLSWTPPQAVPTGYILTYEAPSGEIKEIQLGASANTYQLSELIPLSQYRARVQAVRGRAITAPTSTVFTTARLRYPFPRDCAEERLNGVSRSQVVTIYLDGERNRPIKVFCDMETDGGGWIVFQRRMNGKTNFWRNWQDYALGFGNLTQEFWLGNENLHKITSQGVYELRVDLRTKNESAYAIYDSFRVDTQASYYRLRLGKYSGTAGDSLSYHNNMIFSTRDRDRNKHIMPCAISYRGAWWYKNCHYVNLNGLYGNNKDHQGVNWYDWKGFEFSIPFTEMKMRPKNSLALRRI
ncbi:tenascin-X isoform X14 [Ambystoma mexicanum]|uniref:tenascin-X isoform X14 n=1 Tax=Ambystoma mexicanum TaxID=8296 RepID=UPI0037E70ACD